MLATGNVGLASGNVWRRQCPETTSDCSLLVHQVSVLFVSLYAGSQRCKADCRLSDSLPFSPTPWIYGGKKSLVFQCSCDHQEFTLWSTSAISATTVRDFIGLLSRMTPWKRCHLVSHKYHFVASVTIF